MKTMAEATAVSPPPPYVTGNTFFGFLEGLAENGLPTQIDKSLMPSMSGGTQSQMLATLRYLGFIEDNGAVQSSLKELLDCKAAGDSEQYQSLFKVAVDAAYASVVNGVEISKATPKLIADRFREAGAKGSINAKAIRLFLRMLKEAGEEIPERLTKVPKAQSSPGRRKTNNKDVQKTTPGETAERESTSAGSNSDENEFVDFPIPIGTSAGAYYIRIPRDISKDSMPMVQAMVSAVEALAEQNSK